MPLIKQVAAENWDEDGDFDVEDDLQFRQSVASRRTESNAYYDEDDGYNDDYIDDDGFTDNIKAMEFDHPANFATSTQKKLPSMAYSRSVHNLQTFQENSDEDEGEFEDGFGTVSLKTMAKLNAAHNTQATESRLRKQASMRLISTAEKQGIPLPSHFMRDHKVRKPSLKSSLKQPQTLPYASSMADLNATLKSKPKPKPKSKNVALPNNEEDDFNDGFDFGNENNQLTLQNLKRLTLNDTGSSGTTNDEDVFSIPDFKSVSRLSTLSISTSATSATTASGSGTATSYDESDGDKEAFDIEFEDVPADYMSLRKRLELMQKKAAEDAALEASQMSRKHHGTVKKYNTIRKSDFDSFDKGFDVDFLDGDVDQDEEEDLSDGIDLTAFDNLTVKGTIHKNALLGFKGFKHSASMHRLSGAGGSSKLQSSASSMNLRAPRHTASMNFQRSGSSHNNNIDSRKAYQKNEYDLLLSKEKDLVGGATAGAQNTIRARGLRPVQSMAALKQATGSGKSQPKEFTLRRMRSKYFGDGTELDTLDDLPEVASGDNTLKGVPSMLLDKYREKSSTRLAKQKPARTKTSRKAEKSSQNSSHGHHSLQSDIKRKPHMPMLIQRLGAPVQPKDNPCNMRYNSQKQVWEGNDVDAKKFDSVTAKAPGLIAFKSNNLQVIGDMYFDPHNLCWVKRDDAKGDDEEEDPFAGLEDLDEAKDPLAMSRQSFNDSVYGSRQNPNQNQNQHQHQHQHQDYHNQNHNQNQHRVSGQSHGLGMKVSQSMGNLGQISGRAASMSNEFMLSKEFIARLQHEDQRWSRKYSSWIPSDETFSRDYLDEIRKMVIG